MALDQIKSFAQAYAAELGGAVALEADIAMDVTDDIFRKETDGKPLEAKPTQWQAFRNHWANLLFIALKNRPRVW